MGVQAKRQAKTPAPPQQIFASSVTPARYGTRPCISPAVIERQQEAIPFGFRTGQRVRDGADRLAGSPDHLKRTVGQNLRNRKGSPGVLGGRIDGNDALGSVETLPEQLLANAGDIGVAALLNSLRPQMHAEIGGFNHVASDPACAIAFLKIADEGDVLLAVQALEIIPGRVMAHHILGLQRSKVILSDTYQNHRGLPSLNACLAERAVERNVGGADYFAEDDVGLALPHALTHAGHLPPAD